MTCTASQPVRTSSVLADGPPTKDGWVEYLKTGDATQVWKELHRIVRNHPRARLSLTLAGQGPGRPAVDTCEDLTQELYLVLFGKGRFEHYLATGMSNAEIEREISRIELTNLLDAELRKRRPESYRLARRISTLLRSSRRFRPYQNDQNNPLTRRSLADTVYGLKEWPAAEQRSTRALNEEGEAVVEDRLKEVEIRRRDTRFVGCSRDAQLVISNDDLEALMVEVFAAANSPLSVRTLRRLVFSRLPPLDESPQTSTPLSYQAASTHDDRPEWLAVDTAADPEQALLGQERVDFAEGYADEFLSELSGAVRGKSKQFGRMLAVLWSCFLSRENRKITQLEVAARLGLSDSLVSSYRLRIERELRRYSFLSVGEARSFEQAVREQLRARYRQETDDESAPLLALVA